LIRRAMRSPIPFNIVAAKKAYWKPPTKPASDGLVPPTGVGSIVVAIVRSTARGFLILDT